MKIYALIVVVALTAALLAIPALAQNGRFAVFTEGGKISSFDLYTDGTLVPVLIG
ncbi:hypothetical protein [Cupriavidus necator]